MSCFPENKKNVHSKNCFGKTRFSFLHEKNKQNLVKTSVNFFEGAKLNNLVPPPREVKIKKTECDNFVFHVPSQST